jgi:hypothetical protein
MHKRLERASPLVHLRIFLNDTAHLLGLARLSPAVPAQDRTNEEAFHV